MFNRSRIPSVAALLAVTFAVLLPATTMPASAAKGGSAFSAGPSMMAAPRGFRRGIRTFRFRGRRSNPVRWHDWKRPPKQCAKYWWLYKRSGDIRLHRLYWACMHRNW